MKISVIFIQISVLTIVTGFLALAGGCSCNRTGDRDLLYDLGTSMESRSISFENPTGEPGQGGTTASNLGVGRKGFPAKNIAPGDTVTLCDIKGPGTIRHIWMTGGFKDRQIALRSMVIRAYWDGQEHPSIECPLGDFMGSANARYSAYQSAVHSTGINAAFNFWLPMPFEKNGKITLTNDGDEGITIFYQVDYTIGDNHPKDAGRLHVCFLRDNPTILKEDFEILPTRRGKGRFVGAVLGIRTLEDKWWGEGEIKFYMDGDTEFPTICGTGSEDYVGLSYGMQETPYLYHGCSWNRDGHVSMYRWHINDPIYWKEECRVTIQQIGYDWESAQAGGDALYERRDDWSSATFWYEPVPSEPLPEFPVVERRIEDLLTKVGG
ncbi:MAG: glycoside hydrolase family 172 protein [Bacteroidales bacterium]